MRTISCVIYCLLPAAPTASALPAKRHEPALPAAKPSDKLYRTRKICSRAISLLKGARGGGALEAGAQ